MKKIISIFFCILSLSFIFAQEAEENTILHPITGFPEIQEKPFVIFNEGVAATQTTRITVQEERSNFVWQNYEIGAFFEMQTVNMKPYNSILRVAGYYPIFHTFNGMKQIPNQVLLYGADLFYGILFESDMWKYLRFNWAIGPHFAYQLSDEYHHIDLGFGGLLGMELPIAWHWTIVINGLGSMDYANFGTNRKMQPYNVAWKYQVEFGFRFSKKDANKYSYINSKKRAALEAADSN